jgi:uncharacterized damage-inducible protein DinB
VSARTILDEALESWRYARLGFLAEAEGIPEERWDHRPHPRARSVSELVHHILRSGAMMVGELSDPEGDFTRAAPEEILAEHTADLPETATPAELKALLLSTLEAGSARFREVGEISMLQDIRRFDGAAWTRLTWMLHGVAHEEYHRGQLALIARTMGLVPALTKLIHGGAAE